MLVDIIRPGLAGCSTDEPEADAVQVFDANGRVVAQVFAEPGDKHV